MFSGIPYRRCWVRWVNISCCQHTKEPQEPLNSEMRGRLFVTLLLCRHRLRQTKRDGSQRGLQIRQPDLLRRTPIEIIRGIPPSPECMLFTITLEICCEAR